MIFLFFSFFFPLSFHRHDNFHAEEMENGLSISDFIGKRCPLYIINVQEGKLSFRVVQHWCYIVSHFTILLVPIFLCRIPQFCDLFFDLERSLIGASHRITSREDHLESVEIGGSLS